MKSSYRLPALIFTLFAVAGAVWLAPSGEKHSNANITYDPSGDGRLSNGPEPRPSAEVLSIQPRSESDEPRRSVFAGDPAPMEPTAVHEPVEPVDLPVAEIEPPAIPFIFRGRYADANRDILFLESQGRLIFAQKGDLIEDAYRLESVSLETARLRYLPMNHVHTLDLSDD